MMMRNIVGRILGQQLSTCVILGGAAVAVGQTYTPVVTPLTTIPGLSNVNAAQASAHGNQVMVAGWGPGTNDENHTMIWTGPSYNVVDLTTSGYSQTQGMATDGTHQVGIGGLTGTIQHALLWSGTAASLVDLNGSFSSSWAYGVGGNQQVGEATGSTIGTAYHAVMWQGSAASVIDLHPAGFDTSTAFGTDGIHQVGNASSSGGLAQAVLWSGTAASAIVLGPGGYSSVAVAVSGNQQVGEAIPGGAGSRHAAMWSGSAASFVDLGTAGFNSGFADGTNGTYQVGNAYTDPFAAHAVVWSGTAASAVDLHLLLPNNIVSSTAWSVDGSGNVYGDGYDSSHNMYAIEWVLTPEPASMTVLLFPGILLLRRRK